MIISQLLSSTPGIRHGFGTAQELVPLALQPDWNRRPEKVQVHGSTVVEITTHRQACGDIDGLYSAHPGIPISIITADCVPILLARRDGKMVAALHAGWRGLIGGLIESLWRDLYAQNERPANWFAVVGPAVGACCYEVTEELAARFVGHYATLPAKLVNPTPRMLNLPGIAEEVLRRMGIAEVEQLNICTRCALHASGDYVFRSYRRGDRGAQQHSGLIIGGT